MIEQRRPAINVEQSNSKESNHFDNQAEYKEVFASKFDLILASKPQKQQRSKKILGSYKKKVTMGLLRIDS